MAFQGSSLLGDGSHLRIIPSQRTQVVHLVLFLLLLEVYFDLTSRRLSKFFFVFALLPSCKRLGEIWGCFGVASPDVSRAFSLT